MGVRRLFSRGGQNFPGGVKHTICLKITQKDTIFLEKSKKKHTIFPGQGGQEPPLALPCGRPWISYLEITYFSISRW